MLLLDGVVAGQLPDDADVRSRDEACRADDESRSELLQALAVDLFEVMARLGADDAADFREASRLIEDDVAHVDAREAVLLALLAEQFCDGHAEELAHVAAGDHLLEALLTRLLRLCVELCVKAVRRELHEAAGLEVEDHRALGLALERLEVAGVVARRIDGADVGVGLLVGSGEQDGNRVIDDGRRLDIVDALAVQRFLEQVVDDLALDACRGEFLRPDDELRVVEVRLLGGEGEGVAEQVLRRVVALDGLIDELCDEVELLLCRRTLADEVVDAFDAQRLRDFLEDFELAVTVEADAQDADVRAAEVEREVLARLLARRQADVRLEHAQRRLVRILEALAQVIAEVSRDFVEARSVDLEFLDDLSKLVLVKCHDYLPLYILK